MASESRSNSMFGTVPLNDGNYATWKIQCKMALIKERIWGIVNGTEEAPVEDASADKRAKISDQEGSSVGNYCFVSGALSTVSARRSQGPNGGLEHVGTTIFEEIVG